MPRYPYGAPTRGGEMVSLQRAQEAIQRVVTERDALSQQLARAQGTVTSLRRRLEARESESAHLAQALRVAEARQAERRPELLEEEQAQGRRLQRRCDQAEARVRQLELAREEANAERDQERAARKKVEAALAELQRAAPEADRAQRLAADLANVRRNRDHAIEQGVRQETQRLLVEIATIRDAVDRALSSGSGLEGPWKDGLLAIQSRIDAVLAREGVTLVGKVGELFDPTVHEAIGTAEGEVPNMVMEVVSSGLLLEEDTLLTPARVLVSATPTTPRSTS